jgi:predicted amidophosphoribosyltransferase
VVAAYQHVGPARRLVHHLKYSGVGGYPEMVAEMVCDRIPRLPLVPVPRALSRRYKYGVDPAAALALAMSRRMGVPVLSILAGPIHSGRRAGGDHSRRVRPFRRTASEAGRVIVVDDVVTTGRTALAAVHSVGRDLVALVAAANVAPAVSSLLTPDL